MNTPHPSPVLSFRDLHKSFGGGAVLDGVSGEVRPGDVILLRGDNGTGKTTLLNILTGCLEPDAGSIQINTGEAQEHFDFPRSWWKDVNPWDHFTPERVARCGVSRVWQDVRLFPSLGLVDNITAASSEVKDSAWSALWQTRGTRAATLKIRQQASQRLESLGLSGRGESSGDRISLGQSKRVAIARSLQAKGNILMMDEPLSGLDQAGVNAVVKMLRQLVAEHNMALIMIEHVLNAHHLMPLVNTIWELAHGKITVISPSEDKNKPLAAHQFWKREEFQNRYRITHENLERGARLTRLSPVADSADKKNPVFEVKDLKVSRGSHKIIGHNAVDSNEGLSFQLYRGEIAILEAPNGWGKTTFFDAVTGIGAEIDHGDVTLLEETISKGSAGSSSYYKAGGRALRSDARLFPSLKLSELARLSEGKIEVDDADSPIGQLSGGQLRRAAIDATGEGEVVIYDELFHGLDLAKVKMMADGLCNGSSLLLEPTQLLD